jgi:hypothetical protein
MRLYREAHHEDRIIAENQLRFSNYQIIFVNALRPKQDVTLDIRKTLINTIPDLTLTNRVSLKANGKTILLAYKKETQTPLFLATESFQALPDLSGLADKTMVPGSNFFLKRKWMHNGNVKNFLSGSLAEQSDYFDELADLANYPEIFPCSLTSGALLEKALLEQHDFKRNPMVYTSHDISVDRVLLRQIKNNDMLHILVRQLPESPENTLNHSSVMLRTYECFGLLEDHQVLFRIKLNLAPLEEILKNVSSRAV